MGFTHVFFSAFWNYDDKCILFLLLGFLGLRLNILYMIWKFRTFPLLFQNLHSLIGLQKPHCFQSRDKSNIPTWSNKKLLVYSVSRHSFKACCFFNCLFLLRINSTFIKILHLITDLFCDSFKWIVMKPLADL